MLLQTMRIVNPEECHRLEENLRREQVHGMPFEEVVTLIASQKGMTKDDARKAVADIVFDQLLDHTKMQALAAPSNPIPPPPTTAAASANIAGCTSRRPRGSFHTSRPCRFWSLRGSQCKRWEGRRGHLQRNGANPRQNPGRQNRAAASSCRGTFRRNDRAPNIKANRADVARDNGSSHEEKSLSIIHPR